MHRIRCVAVAVAAGAGIVLTGAGTAGADDVNFIGGRERVKVVVNATSDTTCTAYAAKQAQSFAVNAGKSGSGLLSSIPAGEQNVQVHCDNGFIAAAPVFVMPADPVKDALDGIYSGAGSSQLVSDPALR